MNGVAPGILAEEAKLLGSVLVHYSTDYVFDGSKATPYSETDVPNPQSVYGSTKYAGEQAIRATGCKHLILRTSWVYGVHGGNFVKTILRLARERSELRIVADQFGAPTWARDLAQATATSLSCWIGKDLDPEFCGVYHLTAAGRTNWHEYAEEIVPSGARYTMPLFRPNRSTSAPSPRRNIRCPPSALVNSVLANKKIQDAFGIVMPAWQDSLAECVRLIYEQPT